MLPPLPPPPSPPGVVPSSTVSHSSSSPRWATRPWAAVACIACCLVCLSLLAASPSGMPSPGLPSAVLTSKTVTAVDRSSVAALRQEVNAALDAAESKLMAMDEKAKANGKSNNDQVPIKSPPEPANALQTTWKCYTMGAWSEICVYRNLCHTGPLRDTPWLFLDPELHTELPDQKEFGSAGRIIEAYYWPFDDVAKNYQDLQKAPAELPYTRVGFQSKFNALRIPASMAQRSDNVTWVTDSVIWRPPWRINADHLVYTAAMLMPIFHARKLNESGHFSPPLPSLGPKDVVALAAEWWVLQRDFTRTFVQYSTGNQSRVETLGSPWSIEFETPGQLRCYSQVVMFNPYETGAPDHQTAYEFRQGLYQLVGVPLPQKPVKKVLFWVRNPGTGRAFLNLHAMLAIAEAYGLNYTVITAADVPTTMKGQLELYASHGVYVTVTGAAVSNAMFLVPFSSVIEIFPPLVDQNLGPTVAVINGMGYYPVHTHNATAYYKEIQETVTGSCVNATGLEMVSALKGCTVQAYRWPAFDVDLVGFEAALVSAVDHAGHSLRHRNYPAVPDASSPSGWSRVLAEAEAERGVPIVV